MLSLPESWDLHLCEDLMLLLETRQHQETPTHCSAIRSGQRSDPPGLGPLHFSRGRNRDCNHNRNPTALWGLHIQLWTPLSLTSGSGWQPGAHKSHSHPYRGNWSQGHGWLSHGQMAAWCLEEGAEVSGCTTACQESRYNHGEHHALQKHKVSLVLTPWNCERPNVRQAGIFGFLKARLTSPSPSPSWKPPRGFSE